jgi:uncharacterized protein YecT (DUF1311 family)
VFIAMAAALLSPSLPAAGDTSDPTEAVLARCLEGDANAATAGQTQCEEAAARTYDRRMNMAYAALLKALPPEAARELRQSQRAWIMFRDAEARARSAFYASRHGTMYVPMQAASATRVVRDRALQLESVLRVLRVED